MSDVLIDASGRDIVVMDIVGFSIFLAGLPDQGITRKDHRARMVSTEESIVNKPMTNIRAYPAGFMMGNNSTLEVFDV